MSISLDKTGYETADKKVPFNFQTSDVVNLNTSWSAPFGAVRLMFYSLTKIFFHRKTSAILFLCFCAAFFTAAKAKAETLDLHLQVSSNSASSLVVEGRFLTEQNSAKMAQTRWHFPDNYADAVNLSRRFSKQEFFDASG